MAQIGRYIRVVTSITGGSSLWLSPLTLTNQILNNSLIFNKNGIRFWILIWPEPRCRIPSSSEILPILGIRPDSLFTIEWVGADEEKSHSFVTIIWKHQFGAELPFCDDLHWSDSSLQSCQYRPQYRLQYTQLHSSQLLTWIIISTKLCLWELWVLLWLLENTEEPN